MEVTNRGATAAAAESGQETHNDKKCNMAGKLPNFGIDFRKRNSEEIKEIYSCGTRPLTRQSALTEVSTLWNVDNLKIRDLVITECRKKSRTRQSHMDD